MGNSVFYDFNLTGVSAKENADNLRRLYAALRKTVKDPDDKEEWAIRLSHLRVKLWPDPQNKFDEHAIKVCVYSKKKKGWAQIGFVPRKFKLKRKNEAVSLNKIIAVLIKYKRIGNACIEEIGYFSPRNDGKRVYFCKMSIEITE